MTSKIKERPARAARAGWSELTWDDLEEWADSGSLERGEGYFHGGNVESIAMTPGGVLVAWVEGNERYAVQVALAPSDQSPRLISLCTCPVGYACKHAVAAVLTCLETISNCRPIPRAKSDDPRLRILAQEDDGDADESWDDGPTIRLRAESHGDEASRRALVESPAQSPPSLVDLRVAMAAKSHKELVELAVQLASKLLNVQTELNESAALLTEVVEPAVGVKRQRRKPSGGR
jgi:uncharacterized Zn finger protein